MKNKISTLVGLVLILSLSVNMAYATTKQEIHLARYSMAAGNSPNSQPNKYAGISLAPAERGVIYGPWVEPKEPFWGGKYINTIVFGPSTAVVFIEGLELQVTTTTKSAEFVTIGRPTITKLEDLTKMYSQLWVQIDWIVAPVIKDGSVDEGWKDWSLSIAEGWTPFTASRGIKPLFVSFYGMVREGFRTDYKIDVTMDLSILSNNGHKVYSMKLAHYEMAIGQRIDHSNEETGLSLAAGETGIMYGPWANPNETFWGGKYVYGTIFGPDTGMLFLQGVELQVTTQAKSAEFVPIGAQTTITKLEDLAKMYSTLWIQVARNIIPVIDDGVINEGWSDWLLVITEGWIPFVRAKAYNNIEFPVSFFGVTNKEFRTDYKIDVTMDLSILSNNGHKVYSMKLAHYEMAIGQRDDPVVQIQSGASLSPGEINAFYGPWIDVGEPFYNGKTISITTFSNYPVHISTTDRTRIPIYLLGKELRLEVTNKISNDGSFAIEDTIKVQNLEELAKIYYQLWIHVGWNVVPLIKDGSLVQDWKDMVWTGEWKPYPFFYDGQCILTGFYGLGSKDFAPSQKHDMIFDLYGMIES